MTFDRNATAQSGARQEGTTALAQMHGQLHELEDLLRTMFADVVQTAIASEFDRFMRDSHGCRSVRAQ